MGTAKIDLFAVSDEEFEELCCDILAVKYHVDVSHGCPGRDSGIDGVLRIGETTIVMQAKQYRDYLRLKHEIRHNEVAKAKKLCWCERYVLMTACELNHHQRCELVAEYDGVIRSDSDILSGADIRALLAQPDFSWVLRRHYNLWLGGIDILEAFLGDGEAAKSEALLRDIQVDLACAVTISAFDAAKKLLDGNRVLIITGQAGTGKTTLAKQLVVDSVFSGGYVFVASNSDISVFERQMAMHPERKTLFYLDDFIGANCLELLTGNRDAQIVQLIRRVRRAENIRLIMTSRTNIINDALARCAKLSEFGLEPLLFELTDAKLRRVDKARILYSQMYFGDVVEADKDCVRTNEFYFKIIDHRNFNPRVVSYCFRQKFVSDFFRTNNHSGVKRILWMLDNPSEIWKDCFSRFNALELRLVVFVFLAGAASMSELRALGRRVLARDGFAQFRMGSCDMVIKGLAASVLTNVIARSEPGDAGVEFRLFNPSVGDYIIAQYGEDISFLVDIALDGQSVRVARGMFRAYYFRKYSFGKLDQTKAEVGLSMMERIVENVRNYDADFVLGCFRELVVKYGEPEWIEKLGLAIFRSGMAFGSIKDAEAVARYVHWMMNYREDVWRDARVTKEFLDGLVARLEAAEPIALLNTAYSRNNLERPDGYVKKVIEASSAWADEIARDKSWDDGTSADAVYDAVTDVMYEVLNDCGFDDLDFDFGECCSDFDPGLYATEGNDASYVDDDLSDRLDMSRKLEDQVIRQMFAAR